MIRDSKESRRMRFEGLLAFLGMVCRENGAGEYAERLQRKDGQTGKEAAA